jgi:hypothetical protein
MQEMKVRTPITLALLVAATAAPAARPAALVATTHDPGIAAAIRSHGTLQPVPLITEHSAGQNRLEPSATPKYGGLDPAIATAIRNHETAQPVPLITKHSAGQNRLEPSATPKYGTAPNGFDWKAAGIGATVAFAAMLLGLAAARLLPRRGRAQPA